MRLPGQQLELEQRKEKSPGLYRQGRTWDEVCRGHAQWYVRSTNPKEASSLLQEIKTRLGRNASPQGIICILFVQGVSSDPNESLIGSTNHPDPIENSGCHWAESHSFSVWVNFQLRRQAITTFFL